jgi:Ser/Thr protein kinase RdoA (MazF antagonist)
LAEAFCELGPADASEMLASVGLMVVSEPAALHSQENRLFRVDIDGTVRALKVFRYGRVSDAALTYQLEMVEALATDDVSVEVAVRLPDGSLLGRWEKQQFALFEWWTGSGTVPHDRSGADFSSLGAAIARLHEYAANQAPTAKHYTPWTWGRASLDYLLAHDIVHAAVRQRFAQTAEAVLARATEVWPDEPLVPIHSDLGAWNVLWPNAGPPTIIDFEDLGVGVAWQDLYLLPHSLSNDAVAAGEIEADMHAGYRSVRALPKGGRRLSGLIEAMRGLYIDCWIAARRHDRHFGVRRLTSHTRQYWIERVERLERYAAWADDG